MSASRRVILDDEILPNESLSFRQPAGDRVLVAQGNLAVASPADQAAERAKRQADHHTKHLAYMRKYPIHTPKWAVQAAQREKLVKEQAERDAARLLRNPGAYQWGVPPPPIKRPGSPTLPFVLPRRPDMTNHYF